jgi:hypothetical protein
MDHCVISVYSMRINLKTPFAEKDAVKALGARWDAAKKLWYITDVADLTPFMRWIPDVQAAAENSSANAKTPALASTREPVNHPGSGAITRSSKPVPHCGCKVLPWEHCEHSVNG